MQQSMMHVTTLRGNRQAPVRSHHRLLAALVSLPIWDLHLFVPSLLTYGAMHQMPEHSATLSWVFSFAYLIAW